MFNLLVGLGWSIDESDWERLDNFKFYFRYETEMIAFLQANRLS